MVGESFGSCSLTAGKRSTSRGWGDDSPAGDLRFATSVETHGLDCGPYETFNEEFIVCRECGGRYDVGEWDAMEELPEGSIRSERIETAEVWLN